MCKYEFQWMCVYVGLSDVGGLGNIEVVSSYQEDAGPDGLQSLARGEWFKESLSSVEGISDNINLCVRVLEAYTFWRDDRLQACKESVQLLSFKFIHLIGLD